MYLKYNGIILYSTALLNAVEHSVHLHGPSRLVNYFSIMTVAKHIMTAVNESHVSLYHSASSLVTYQPQHLLLLSDVNVADYFSADQHYECW